MYDVFFIYVVLSYIFTCIRIVGNDAKLKPVDFDILETTRCTALQRTDPLNSNVNEIVIFQRGFSYLYVG